MGYEYDDSPVWLDVKKIINSNSDKPRYTYLAKVHTEEEDISVVKLLNLSTIRDYISANTDYMYAEMKIPFGDYALKIYPFRDNLEISIRLREVRGVNEEKYSKEETDIIIYRYKAIFGKSNKVPNSDVSKFSLETLNNSDVVTVNFQLTEVAAVPIMISRIYGNHKGKTPETLLREVLTRGTANIEIDGSPCLDSIDIYDVDNKEPIKHLVVKDGMHLVEFPRYLQESSNGVYIRGLGTYFQWYKKALRWFIYPTYDVTRFHKDTRPKLIIYSIPNNKYKSVDRTYIEDGDIISIVATAGYDYKDNNQSDELNKGSGFKMQGAKSLMGSPVKIKPDGDILGSRTNTTNEVVFQKRKDGLDYTRYLPTTNNPFQVYSEVIHRSKAEIYVRWEYADPTLLYPGMSCKYVFYDGEEIVEVHGNLAGCDISTVPVGQDLKETPYSTTASLKIFIEPIEKLRNKPPESTTFGDF